MGLGPLHDLWNNCASIIVRMIVSRLGVQTVNRVVGVEKPGVNRVASDKEQGTYFISTIRIN